MEVAPLELLIRGLLPARCAICERPCSRRALACSRCTARLFEGPSWRGRSEGLDEAWAAAPYEGVPRALVGALKFRSRVALARLAAEAIAAGAPQELCAGTVVAVPPAPSRARRRGFDSADLIAVALSRLLALPLDRCLEREAGRRQVGRSRAQRIGSPPGVRALSQAPAEALLVDDVITTGATLASCSRALRERGSERVVALALCRSLGIGVPPA